MRDAVDGRRTNHWFFFNRDEEALRLTERKYGRYIHSLCYSILNSDDDSLECANDALLIIWNHIPPDNPRCFKAYLTRVVRNIALMRLRSKNSAKRAPGEYTVAFEDLCETLEGPENVETAFEEEKLKELLDDFLRSLTPNKRYIFIARYCHSAQVSQIARELRVSERSVFSALSSLKKDLKKKLEKEGLR